MEKEKVHIHIFGDMQNKLKGTDSNSLARATSSSIGRAFVCKTNGNRFKSDLKKCALIWVDSSDGRAVG